ncbi:MAG: outer membrane protein assembly factor BamD [Gammaproteobacteria bacterium]|nr:outer membrane protein assembly factor BamD [Gammaproteobacteria bacterium]
MMLRLSAMLRVVILPLMLCMLWGCNSNKDLYKGLSAEQIYADAQKNLAKENYQKSSKALEALEARYPYSEYSDKAQLDLIYAYHKNNEPALALSAANRFIRMNPHHPRVDYAYYLKGLTRFEQNYSFTFRYLPLDRSARDPSALQESFDTFKQLLERFPKSEYAPDAKKRMVFLRNMLANHERQVMDYYVKRGAYLSAINRAIYIIQHFEKTPAVPLALKTMVQCYEKLGMPKLAEEARKTLESNFPAHAK